MDVSMDFLKQRALKEIQFYLKECHGNVGICFNHDVPVDVLSQSPVTSFYYYQNSRPTQPITQTFIRGELSDLPFLTDSIDMFVIWHNLDLHTSPQKVVKELWRSLSPNGVLLIVGANSSYFFSALQNENQKKGLITRSWLARLLAQQGFTIEVENTFGFHPRFSAPWLMRWCGLMEIIGQFCWPMSGANFLFQARKSQLGLNFPLVKVKRKILLSPKRLTEPTGRI